ncbi:MAG TPA: hypothetical protein VIK18_11965 [Pirellulales bacterium]
MSYGLSPQNEQYLESIVAGGLFPTMEAALDAAVEALREKEEDIPFICDEHMDAVEEALEDPEPSRLMTADDWSRLREYAHEVARRKNSGDV